MKTTLNYPVSDWSVVRIFPRFLCPIGPSRPLPLHYTVDTHPFAFPQPRMFSVDHQSASSSPVQVLIPLRCSAKRASTLDR
eukprot:1176356-Prorocentrum_minimum.AAC.5